MRRLSTKALVFIWVLVLIFNELEQYAGTGEAPAFTPPTEEEPYSGRRPPIYLPRFHIQSGDKPSRNSSMLGTAFALDNKGNWLTARHVIEDCQRAFLMLPGSRTRGRDYIIGTQGKRMPVLPAKISLIDRNADLALLKTSPQRQPALKLARQEPYNTPYDQPGFAIGFPNDTPGEVALRLMGHGEAVLRLGNEFTQRSLVWSIEKTNPTVPRLQGISGGPVINEQGEAIGTNMATGSNGRRGRFITSMPETINGFLRNVPDYEPPSSVYAPNEPLDSENYSEAADELRGQITVAEVVCFSR